MQRIIFRYILPVLAIVAIFFLLRTWFTNTQNVQVSKITLHSNKLPANNPGLKIVQLSDLHISVCGDYEAKVAEMVNKLEPDIIVITGDFFKHSEYQELPLLDKLRAEMEQILIFLQSLRAKHGIYISRGNADFSNDSELSNYFIAELEKHGFNVLANEGMTTTINDNTYCLSGIDFPAFEKADVADFQIRGSEENQYIQSFPSRKNSYSHYLAIKDIAQWQNYTYSGRLRVNVTEENGAGIVFYSQFYRGYDWYYRLRQTGTDGTFQFSGHWTKVKGERIDTGITIKAKQWLRFKIQCITHKDYTEMRARLWADGTTEPIGWNAWAADSSATRLSGGAVGLWSGGKSKHQFDDLLVVDDRGDTLLNENFEQAEMQKYPMGWVAYNYGYQAIPVLMDDAPPNAYSIMLSHTPDYAFYAQPGQVDLVLSGHTHGGQIRIPVIGPLYKNIKSPKKYMQGMHDINGTTLYVNRGIGLAWLPLRLFCSPEITCIQIVPE